MNISLAELVGKNYYTFVAEEKPKYEDDKSGDQFFMRPVMGFVFKLLFGNPKRIERLKSFLVEILKIPLDELQDINILNPELAKDFKDDKYGRLDIRASLKDGRQINIEMQVLNYSLMPEMSLYYWSKMYTQQIKESQGYDDLKK